MSTAQRHKPAPVAAGATTENNQEAQAGSLSPSLPVQDRDQKEILDIYDRLQRRKAQLIGPDGERRELPPTLHSFLIELLDALGQGKSISILQGQNALGTIQASEILGVSRRFLVGLLERGEIAFHRVGSHRRIYARDLFRYKAQRDSNRSAAIRDLARSEYSEGLYDQISPLEVDDNQ